MIFSIENVPPIHILQKVMINVEHGILEML